MHKSPRRMPSSWLCPSHFGGTVLGSVIKALFWDSVLWRRLFGMAADRSMCSTRVLLCCKSLPANTKLIFFKLTFGCWMCWHAKTQLHHIMKRQTKTIPFVKERRETNEMATTEFCLKILYFSWCTSPILRPLQRTGHWETLWANHWTNLCPVPSRVPTW